MIRINCWFRWHFLGFHSISLMFLGFSLNFVQLFWAFTKFHWPFWGIQLSTLIRIKAWLKQYHEDLSQFNSWLNRLSRNWLRIISWLKCIPQALIQIDSWLKVLPFFRFRSTHDSWQNRRKAFDSKSTHDSTLSHTHVCLHHRCCSTLHRPSGPLINNLQYYLG